MPAPAAQQPAPPAAAHAADDDCGEVAGSVRPTSSGSTVAPFRIRDLNRLLNSRWGPILPDDDSGRGDVAVMLSHLAHISDAQRRMMNFLDLRAPWMQPVEREEAMMAAFRFPAKWSADDLATVMRLTLQERSYLGITTIGAIDCDAEGRKKLRAEKGRIREAARRRAGRMKQKSTHSISATRAAAIFAALAPDEWVSIAVLCGDLAKLGEFVGAESSIRSAAHRAIDHGLKAGFLKTEIRPGAGGFLETLVARSGAPKCR